MSPAPITEKSLPEGVTDVLVTHLLTATVDPQRNRRWNPDPEQCSILFDSAAECGAHVVLIHDEKLSGPVPGNVTTVRVKPYDGDVYWRRWEYSLEWLDVHPEVENVFCVDGSDVRVLRDPFEGLDDETLYLGSELAYMNDRWMVRNHRHPKLRRFFLQNAGRRAYNAGIVGGRRDVVREFVAGMLRHRSSMQASGEVGSDMGLLNYTALRPYWRDRIVTGPSLHTVFKKYETSHPTAKFAHK